MQINNGKYSSTASITEWVISLCIFFPLASEKVFQSLVQRHLCVHTTIADSQLFCRSMKKFRKGPLQRIQ